MHRAHPFGRRLLAVEEMQKMSANGFIVGFDFDTLPLCDQ